MKIALLDLNHSTRGVTTNCVPLGIGMLARYLRKTVNHSFDIRMFKDTDKALKGLRSWKPDVAGITQYSWNSELNLYFASLIKENNPGCLVIAGGPNIDLLDDGRIKYFKQYPFVDTCVSYDGEIPFATTVSRLLKGESVDCIRKHPSAGIFSYNMTKEAIIESPEAPPRLSTLDVFGPIFADGVFDGFIEDGCHPFMQTQRGCPFSCAYCNTANKYHSRILFLSPEIFRCDIEYIGKRLAGRHDVPLYLANTNMSFYKEDFAIAKIIREVQDKYDWPKLMIFDSGKNPKKLLEILSIIRFNPAVALQTLTPSVLKNINRVNIPLKDYVAFQHSVLKKTDQTSATELILNLPGESKKSFLETVKEVLNSGVQSVVIYTLMNLKGTRLSSSEMAKKYGYDIRYRLVPRDFSLINGKKIFDVEEVVVGTKTMPFKDYLELRGLCFTITTFFSSTELIPVKKLLLEYKADISEWVFSINRRLSEFPDITRYYHEFMHETKTELFPTKEALLAFFDKAENWEALCSGRYGDNLVRKYKQTALYNSYKTVLEISLSEAQKQLGGCLRKEKAELLFKDMMLCLSARDVKDIFEDADFIADRTVHLNYDIPAWLSSPDNASRIEDFYGECTYRVKFGDDIKKKTKDFIRMNKEKDLSLQILYRDGSIRNFWPEWVKVKDH